MEDRVVLQSASAAHPDGRTQPADRITELNRIDKTPLAFEGKTFSGEYLMQNGLEIPYGHNADWGKANEWASRVLLLEEVK